MSETGLLSLPNELLLHILTPLPTLSLLPLTPTCHRMHAIILRIIHNRLLLAANLRDHTLLLECYHPSAKLTEPPLYCTYLRTEGLDTALELDADCLPDNTFCSDENLIGRLGTFTNFYSRFRPHRRAPDPNHVSRRHPAGDIPGSRTHPSSSTSSWLNRAKGQEGEELVKQVLSLEGHELFTQLCGVVTLAKAGPRSGLFLSFVEVEEGYFRVWKDWLKRASERGDAVEPVVEEVTSKGKERTVSEEPQIGRITETEEERILWVKPTRTVGMKVKIKERRWRRDNPIMVLADEDVAVSYDIEYEELVVRTSHLLLKIEESLVQQTNVSVSTFIKRIYSPW